MSLKDLHSFCKRAVSKKTAFQQTYINSGSKFYRNLDFCRVEHTPICMQSENRTKIRNSTSSISHHVYKDLEF